MVATDKTWAGWWFEQLGPHVFLKLPWDFNRVQDRSKLAALLQEERLQKLWELEGGAEEEVP